MRKKTLVLAYLMVLSLGTILSLYIPKKEVAAKDAIVIPGQAIRLRILANSDLNADQELKRQVRDKVNAKISVWVKDLTSIEEARKVIQSKLPEIKATAEEVVKQHGSKQVVEVKFGKVQFPTKLYGQFLYPAGEYEAVLITLGAGKGANWWCVLFPPLCFLDFSNGVAVSNGFDDHSSGGGKKSARKEKATEAEKKQPDQADGKNTQAAEPQKQEDVQSEQEQSNDAEPKRAQMEDAHQKRDIQQEQSNDAEPKQAQMEGAHQKRVIQQEQPDDVQPKQEQAADVNQQPEKTAPAKQKDAGPASSKSTAAKEQDHGKKAPVYTPEDEEPVKVKFFIVELWKKLF